MAEDKIGKCGETAMAKPILFMCAEDALVQKALEMQSPASRELGIRLGEMHEVTRAVLRQLRDRARGECPLCGYDDQRCKCWETTA